MRKRKNKRIVLLILVVMFTIFPIVSKANSNNYEYITITVQEGDTLWSIASCNKINNDIRKTVYTIRKFNSLDSAVIMPGQELMIPIN